MGAIAKLLCQRRYTNTVAMAAPTEMSVRPFGLSTPLPVFRSLNMSVHCASDHCHDVLEGQLRRTSIGLISHPRVLLEQPRNSDAVRLLIGGKVSS